MKTITLTVRSGPEDDEAVKLMDGKHIIGSIGCLEHGVDVLVIAPQGAGVDVVCTLRSLKEMIGLVTRSAAAKGFSDAN